MVAKLLSFIKAIFSHAMDTSESNIVLIRTNREKFFVKSKILSDFIQIILSLSVCLFILSKFNEYVSNSISLYDRVLFGGAAISALMFLVHFSFYTTLSVYYYVLSQIVIFENYIARFLIFLFYLVAYIGTIHGMFKLITELSRTFSK